MGQLTLPLLAEGLLVGRALKDSLGEVTLQIRLPWGPKPVPSPYAV